MYELPALGPIGKKMCTQAVHKNNSVSGRAAGWLKKVRLETSFFSFLQKTFFPPKNGQYFPTNKTKKVEKKIAAARLASILVTRWTGNRLFFMDSLSGCTSFLTFTIYIRGYAHALRVR